MQKGDNTEVKQPSSVAHYSEEKGGTMRYANKTEDTIFYTPKLIKQWRGYFLYYFLFLQAQLSPLRRMIQPLPQATESL